MLHYTCYVECCKLLSSDFVRLRLYRVSLFLSKYFVVYFMELQPLNVISDHSFGEVLRNVILIWRENIMKKIVHIMPNRVKSVCLTKTNVLPRSL